MALRKPSYVTKYNETGYCEIDSDKVVADWLRMPRLWMVSTYQNDWRLIRYIRKDSTVTSLKVNISRIAAGELIRRVGLTCIKSDIFNNASTFIKKETDA